MIDNQSNRIQNTLVACRLPLPLKERAESYGQRQDLNLSQIIRRGILLVLDQDQTQERPSKWLTQK